MLRFADSFDHYTTIAQMLAGKWTSSPNTGSLSISSGNGRNGTQSFRIGAPNAARRVDKTLDAQGTWIFHFGWRCSNFTNWNSGAICGLLDAGTLQCDLRVLPDGTLRATRNGTTLGTSVASLSANVYAHIGFKVVISDTVGAVDIWVDGVSVLSLTGQDTKNTANATANQIFLGSPIGVNAIGDWDDLVVCDGQGSVNNNFLGDLRVVADLPDANGNQNDWTPSAGSNFENVDDASPDDDTTYNSSDTADQVDLYQFPDLAVSGTVKGVAYHWYGRKDDAGTRTVAPVVRQGGTDYVGSNQNLGDSYAYQSQVYEQDPDTGAPWMISGVNSAEAGLKLIA